MAATTAVTEYYGSGPSSATISNLRFSTADESAGSSTTYPCVKPAAGTNYSFMKAIALTASVAPAGSITNIKFYTDGTNNWGTGISALSSYANTWTQATGTTGASGTQQLSTGTGAVDPFTYTSASPLSVSSNATTGTGRLSYYVFLQVALSTSCTPGTTSTETLTLRYDET